MRRRPTWGRILLYAFLIVGSFVMAYPMLYAILGSLCDLQDFYRSPWLPFPTKVYVENYAMFFGREFIQANPLWTWVLNSVIRIFWYIAIPGTVAVLPLGVPTDRSAGCRGSPLPPHDTASRALSRRTPF